jgi:hypothetical protein
MPGEYKNLPNGIQMGVSTVWVTSDFTPSHQAIDLTPATPLQTPARARMSMIYTTTSGGVTVELEHSKGFTTVYKHLVAGSVIGHIGDILEKSIKFAVAGKTGVVTGPHAHYGVYINGIAQDPLPYLQGKLTIPPYVTVETNLAVKSVTPMLRIIIASRIRAAGGLNGAILAEADIGQEFPYLGKTKLVDGYEWARIDFNGVIGYMALNTLWNTVVNPPPVEVYKPFEGTFEKDGMSCTVSLKPLQK